MAWLKTVGCDCPECGPGPCDPGCGCFFFAGDGIFNFFSSYDWSEVNAIDHDISIAVDSYADCDSVYSGSDLSHYFQIQIYADGNLIYDSGCVAANFSTFATVPAGTTTLEIIVTAPCVGMGCESGGGGFWTVECVS